jgi:RimJ/RimL family protein N-acetyltransferase
MAWLARPLPTARLLLRPFTLADVEDVVAYQCRPDVTRYLVCGPRSRTDVEESVRRMSTLTELSGDGDSVDLAVELDGRVIGQVDLVLLSVEHGQGEIGYLLHPDHHGRGLATEAAAELLRLGFEEIGLHRIVALCHVDNRASAAVAQRLGMRREAHFLGCRQVGGVWRDEFLHAVLRDEWLVRSSR